MTDIWLRNGIMGSKAIDNSTIGVRASAPTHTQLTKRNTDFGVDIGRNHTSVATAHRDMATTAGYGLLQSNTGSTFLHAAATKNNRISYW